MTPGAFIHDLNVCTHAYRHIWALWMHTYSPHLLCDEFSMIGLNSCPSYEKEITLQKFFSLP